MGRSSRGGGCKLALVLLPLLLALGGCGSSGAGPGPDGGASGGAGSTSGGGGVATARPAPAFPIFDDTRIHDVALTMSPEDWQSILDDIARRRGAARDARPTTG